MDRTSASAPSRPGLELGVFLGSFVNFPISLITLNSTPLAHRPWLTAPVYIPAVALNHVWHIMHVQWVRLPYPYPILCILLKNKLILIYFKSYFFNRRLHRVFQPYSYVHWHCDGLSSRKEQCFGTIGFMN